MIASDLNDTKDYFVRPDHHLPDAKKTTFHLHTLPAQVIRLIKNDTIQQELLVGGQRIRSSLGLGDQYYKAVKFGVTWDNLLDRSGSPVKWRREHDEEADALGLDRDSMNHVSKAMAELGREVLKFNRLEATDELEATPQGNAPSPAPPAPRAAPPDPSSDGAMSVASASSPSS